MLRQLCLGWFTGADRYVIWYGGFPVSSGDIGRYPGLMGSYNTAFISKKSNRLFDIIGEIDRS